MSTVLTQLETRHAQPGDEADILVLLNVGMQGPGAVWSPEFWHWKHIANPFGQSAVMIAEDEGRIVGLRAFMRWQWNHGGTPMSAVRAVDTATHPDFRGKGIFKKLTLQLRDELEQQDIHFVFNTPNGQSRPDYLKMGWGVVGRPTLWIRPVHPFKLIRSLRSEGLGGEEGESPVVDALPAAKILATDAAQSIAANALRTSAQKLQTPVDLAYLQWRYGNVPGYAYHAVVQGDGADGVLIIFRTRRRGALKELRVCEIVVGSSGTANKNLRRVLRRIPKLADVDVVLTMTSGEPSRRRAFAATGFLPAPRTGPGITAYAYTAVTERMNLYSLSNWGASIGDLELFEAVVVCVGRTDVVVKAAGRVEVVVDPVDAGVGELLSLVRFEQSKARADVQTCFVLDLANDIGDVFDLTVSRSASTGDDAVGTRLIGLRCAGSFEELLFVEPDVLVDGSGREFGLRAVATVFGAEAAFGVLQVVQLHLVAKVLTSDAIGCCEQVEQVSSSGAIED